MRAIALCLAALALAAFSGENAERAWIHHQSFEDFIGGSAEDGGVNLYAARAGGVRVIHRYDYNNDGYIDLISANDHNSIENEDVLVYRGKPGGPESILPPLASHAPLGHLLREVRARENNAIRLPSYGGGRSLVADLNRDGFPDLVVCNNIHNYSVDINALVYWGGNDGFRADRRTELPTLMASGVAAADFNRDGYLDLAFANRGTELGERFGFDMNRESWIYWNSATGFDPRRRTSVPSVSAIDIAAVDLDGDAYPELLIANNNSREKSFYLYRGGPQGISEQRRIVWSSGDPVGMRIADLTGDGRPDLLLVDRANRAILFEGNGSRFAEKPSVELPVTGARECRVGDLNGDGRPDLVCANGEGPVSWIYWNSSAGFSADRRTALPSRAASDAAIADFNGDGRPDVAFANEYDGETYDTASLIYWNSAQGFHETLRAELQGFGPVNAQAADIDGDGHPELMLISRNSRRRGAIDSFIYWGNGAHFYSPSRITALPSGADGVLPSFADFDQDGFADLLFSSGYLYAGGRDGFSAARRRELGFKGGSGPAVGDLNRDGWLDVVLAEGMGRTKGVVVWGSREGFENARRTEFPIKTRLTLAPNVADLNKDGWLDAIFPDIDSENFGILWGGPNGPSAENATWLSVQPAASVEIADLNRDGSLDLLLGGGWESRRYGRPTREATILWGGPGGYSVERAQKLEAYCSLEQAVADFNKDGWLDIAMTNYHAYTTRTIPMFIYWGGPQGYSVSRRDELPAESSAALLGADLNADGWIDLTVFNHVARGNHSAGTKIFWNGPGGFSFARHHWLPTFGPHFGPRHDPGNIYTREFVEAWVSQPLEVPRGSTPARIAWTAEEPQGTRIRFQVRSAPGRDDLARASWRGESGPGTHFDKSGAQLSAPPGHQWWQYRAILQATDGGWAPTLKTVTLTVR